jgi:hypothetical protein
LVTFNVQFFRHLFLLHSFTPPLLILRSVFSHFVIQCSVSRHSVTQSLNLIHNVQPEAKRPKFLTALMGYMPLAIPCRYTPEISCIGSMSPSKFIIRNFTFFRQKPCLGACVSEDNFIALSGPLSVSLQNEIFKNVFSNSLLVLIKNKKHRTLVFKRF